MNGPGSPIAKTMSTRAPIRPTTLARYPFMIPLDRTPNPQRNPIYRQYDKNFKRNKSFVLYTDILNSLNWKQTMNLFGAIRVRFFLQVIALVLAGCDREIGRPYCGEVTSPQDYGKFVVDGEKGIAQHISGTVWYRCAAGQSFRGKKCIGEPVRVTRAQADGYIREFSENLVNDGGCLNERNSRVSSKKIAIILP